MIQELRYEDIAVGDQASFSKTVSESDIYLFAGITGDFNPMHVDQEYAKKTIFGERIAHGMLTASFISTVLGMKLPGPNTIYLSQNVRFLAPVRIGDTLTVTAEVIEKNDRKRQIRLQTKIVNQQGTIVADGEALVMKKG
ncbi:MaoC family dehydratase [Brevibacillus sp. SYSU BS000544]|uniref:MaoC family dehydratase n=1 Tax=Brevibacillus sp. SYSU BS000544 TaxID=3416443 RepID=UPI003CE4972F